MEFGRLQFVYIHMSSNICWLSQFAVSRHTTQLAGPGQPVGQPQRPACPPARCTRGSEQRTGLAPDRAKGQASALRLGLALPRTGSRAGSSAPVLKSGQHRGRLAQDQPGGGSSALASPRIQDPGQEREPHATCSAPPSKN